MEHKAKPIVFFIAGVLAVMVVASILWTIAVFTLPSESENVYDPTQESSVTVLDIPYERPDSVDEEPDLHEFSVGENATCVWVWQNGERMYLAQEASYYAGIPPEWESIAPTTEIVNTCKSDSGDLVMLLVHDDETLEDAYLWTLLLSRDFGITWERHDFEDDLLVRSELMGCRVEQFLYDDEGELRVVTTECTVADIGGVRHGYSLELLDGVALPIYSCATDMRYVTHPELSQPLWQEFGEECEVLYE